MKLDFLLCGSANDAFFSQIAFFRLCLNALGGVYSDARVVAVFGDYGIKKISSRWRQYFNRINVEWDTSTSENDEHMGPFSGRHYRRFECIRLDADLAILCDADVAVMAPFNMLVDDLQSRPALAGAIAHFHFVHGDGNKGNPDVDWPEISKAIIGKDIERPYQYTLYGKNCPFKAPFYINYGVLIGTPALLKDFHARAIQLQGQVYDMTRSWFAAQIAVPLVCADLELPTLSLPMRYNFPNDSRADAMYPEEMNHIKFLHYLRTNVFDRHKIFSDKEYYHAFLKEEMEGSNEMFRRHVYKMTGGHYPFKTVSLWNESLQYVSDIFRKRRGKDL